MTLTRQKTMCGVLGAVLMFSLPVLHAGDNAPADIRDLDRLFTTRAERAELDAMRRGGGEINRSATSSYVASPQIIEMKGIMQRERGAPVAWVNDGNTLNSERIDDSIRVRAENIGSKSAVINNGSRAIRLKPGQVWQDSDNKIVERYQTSVAEPVTKGADDTAASVQTETDTAAQTPTTAKTETGKTDDNPPKP